jgi:hypothetical protein
MKKHFFYSLIYFIFLSSNIISVNLYAQKNQNITFTIHNQSKFEMEYTLKDAEGKFIKTEKIEKNQTKIHTHIIGGIIEYKCKGKKQIFYVEKDAKKNNFIIHCN